MQDSTTSRQLTPEKSILLATESRSGSNYLCALMTDTGQMGVPDEYFSQHSRIKNVNTLDDRIAHIRQKAISSNGVISTKLFPEHWKLIEKQINIDTLFPDRYWLWLRRKDILAQAISRDIALQTRAWTGNKMPQTTPGYSAIQIRDRLCFIARSEARWRVFFARNAITPLELWYEDLVESPKKTLLDIAAFSGIDVTPETINPDVGIKKQSTQVNSKWQEKYVAEMGDINRMDNIHSSRHYKFSLENLKLLWRGKLQKP